MSKNTETKDPSAQGSALNISKRSFIIAIAIIFALMVTTYILTLVVPGGEYARTIDANGNTIIDTADSDMLRAACRFGNGCCLRFLCLERRATAPS